MKIDNFPKHEQTLHVKKEKRNNIPLERRCLSKEQKLKAKGIALYVTAHRFKKDTVAKLRTELRHALMF